MYFKIQVFLIFKGGGYIIDLIPDVKLDVTEECCPYPLIKTKKKMDELESGIILQVMASDPVAPQNIDAWAKKSGNKLLAVEVKDGIYNIYVQKA